jgi:hypothetical protein
MKDYLRILMPPNSETDGPELANGGPAPYIRKMDRRLIILETRFDTILPTLATKADLISLKSELRADIHAFMVNTIITLVVGFGGMIIAMVTLLRSG